MLKKDEVSKYTVPKNALDMLEWPPYSSKYTAKDIPMTDSNIHPPSQTNPIPGTEVTTSPGLVPETIAENSPNTENVTAAVGDIVGSADTYAATVDHLVDSMPQSEAGHHPEMPIYTETETAHQELMNDPQYAIATHEHTLNKYADLLEQIVARLNSIEEKLNLHIEDSVGPDPNDPLSDYPEVKQHQNK